ncbi:hypothetical protein [Fusobacterium mortiferum]|jgi:hypothetical protein|uniref:hypothetical protein n=1 Tax=Fusobacterium mortiferum TaxID=850 RepID=UPI000E4500A7|nr:hypothetical protein [Fusobacterium mortiferum]MDD7263257.1 hypothetical protein [Fusobacterium mortiferum]MDY2801550.1 hypothetical protein [Fusobacterium mortiferum]MDY5980138.1 hypothetical protein [Fusobacterium mortiferum]RGN01261.1 hypothetical protein DXB84_01280 [Fusobacterium mortiferum]
MAISKDRFREAVNEFYSKEVLFKLYTKYFLDWIAEGYIGSNLGLFEISLISENSNKQTFLDLLEQFYSKEEIFCTIFEKLDKDVREVFEEVAWNGKFFITNRERFLKLENNYDINKDLKEEFLFFKADKDIKKGEYLYLDYDILRVIRKYMKKPEEYNIIPQKKIKANLVNSNEKELIENFKMYFEFYSQGGVKLSSSAKILKESKLNMKKYCNITEYYEDSKDLDYLKTETIALFFFLVKDKYIDENYFKVSNIKNIVGDFISGELIKEENYHYTSLYLNYLKGVKNIWKSKEEIKRGFATIKKIIDELPDDKPVSVDNIIKAILYRDEFIEIIDVKDAYDYIYINEANYERTKILNYEKYQMYVVIPFIKSVLFLLGVLGVFEIYYDYPSINNSLYLKNGYLSKYDGIKYIKFTELGRYCFDRIDEYDFKNAKEDGEVILDEDRLIATLMGDAPVKTMFLERVSQRIATNKYKFTRENFLRGISSSKEIEERINEFYTKITSEPNQLWREFFEDILEKSSVIKAESQFVVLKLKNDKELIKTITKDERFKPLMLKGEDFHLLIKSENVSEVISLFKEHGYYVNF